nr:MAG TPA: hypothetical protein [Caudoviricetes sp.]
MYLIICGVPIELILRYFNYTPNIMESLILGACFCILYEINNKKKSPPAE